MASPFAGRHTAAGQTPEQAEYVGRHRAIYAHDVRDDPETAEALPPGVVGFPVGGRASKVAS